MKFLNHFKVISLYLCLLIISFTSCEKNPAILLDTNEVESLVQLQRNIVNEFSISENLDKLIQSNKEDLVLFENKFSVLYQNFGEEFITLYNEINTEKINKDYEFIFVGKVTLRGTPCWDSFKAADRSNTFSYGRCIIQASSPGDSANCLADYIINDLNNHEAFERCLEDTYE